jgi:D-glycero-alpha-D-manno-heptose-7-phosphate kinase
MTIQSVLSLAPLRVSFLGGGTDISNFYDLHKGSVVSAAIDKYVYVHIKRHDPLFQEKYRVAYSETEHALERIHIKNDIVRACLEYLEMDEPLQISTSADLPANSGLGSSSSFAVALLLGLHAMKNENVSPVQIAEEACAVEVGLLSSPIGKQDQYAAAFGGLNHYEFHSGGRVTIEPLYMKNFDADLLFSRSVLVWTGQSRKAGSILEDQASRSELNELGLIEIAQLAEEFKQELSLPKLNWVRLGSLIQQGWQIKKTLSSKIETPEVHAISAMLDDLNCYGYKLLGAGGGGFMFALVEDPNKLLAISDWQTFQPKLNQTGARIISVN